MSKKDDALTLALEALEQIDEAMPFPVAKLAQKAIREALMSVPDGAESRSDVEQPYAQTAAYIESATNGRVHVDPVTGDVSIGKEQPVQQESEAVRAAWMAGYTEGEREAIEATTLASQSLRDVKPWVGLTQEDMYEIGEFKNTHGYVPTGFKRLVAAIEAKLKEKNGF